MGRIVTSCVFAVATGRWQPSDRIPSVREGARLWGVAPATVQEAYRRLVARGLIRSEPRRGFYVAEVAGLDRNRDMLEALFGRVDAMVAETGLSPVGVFRYLGRLADQRAAESPECAFVECTSVQAARHAAEVGERFGLHCLPLDLRELDVSWERPPGLRVVFTTAFHLHEVERVRCFDSVAVHAVPISICGEELRSIARAGTSLEILHATAEQGALVAQDMERTGIVDQGSVRVTACTVEELPAKISERLGRPASPTPGRQLVLSMYLWEAITADWRQTGQVRPYPYRIEPGAWPEMADVLGLPLGAWTRPGSGVAGIA